MYQTDRETALSVAVVARAVLDDTKPRNVSNRPVAFALLLAEPAAWGTQADDTPRTMLRDVLRDTARHMRD